MGANRGSAASVRLGTLVSIGLVLVVLGHARLNSLKALAVQAGHRAGTGISNQSHLTCSDLSHLARWIQKNYGGPRTLDLHSASLRDRALTLFLTKVDPHKLLFTESEASDFMRGGRSAWGDLLDHNRCGFFQNWLGNRLSPARHRLDESVSALPVAGYPTAGNTKVSRDANFLNYANYSKDASQLQKRVEETARLILNSSAPTLLAAYQGNKADLVLDTLHQTLFEEQTFDPKALLVKAMLSAIDPFSTYFSSPEFEDFYYDLAGGATGIGVRVRRVPEGYMIQGVIADSPAGRSHQIRVGDIIASIDGVDLKTLSPSQARKLFKGPESSLVKLQLKRNLHDPIYEIALRREHFTYDDGKVTAHVETIGSSQKKIAVVSVPSFYGRGGMGLVSDERSSAEDVRTAIEALLQSGPKISALVLDLRGNPGGYLEEAVSMAGLFLGDRPVVGVVENHQTRVMQDELSTKALYQGPLVVLVDEGTASAAEVLTGALKDQQRAVVVGTARTYGKGSVQKLFHLNDVALDTGVQGGEDKGVVKLTTSIFYSPLGHTPANGGIQSQIVIARPEVFPGETLYAPSLGASVPEISPVIDSPSLDTLKLRSKNWQETIDELNRLERGREGSQLLASSSSRVLKEATQIASDLANLPVPPGSVTVRP